MRKFTLKATNFCRGRLIYQGIPVFNIKGLTDLPSGGGGLTAKRCPTLEAPGTGAQDIPLSLGFSRQEYWSVLPFPSTGDLPDPGMETAFLASPALVGRFLTRYASREAYEQAFPPQRTAESFLRRVLA